MVWTYDFWFKSFSDPSNFWAMLTAIATISLVGLARWQLRGLVQTGRSDFIYKLKKDFFTDEARRLIFLIENELLEFKPEGIGHFEVIVADKDADVRERMGELGINALTISTYLVDDILLGPLEDVGLLLKRGLVSIEETYEHFETYVQTCAEDNAIKQYLTWSREGDGNEDVYDNFQELYERLKEYGPKRRIEKLRKKL